MKDFTTTSFGLVIAYLLPGFLALYGASSWSSALDTIVRNMLGGNSDAALVLAVAAFAIIVGLFVNSLRWLIFERVLCSKYKVPPSVIASLKEEPKLKAFLMVIEETFRYHQFYGSLTLLIPMLCFALVRQFNVTFSQQFGLSVLTLLLVICEFVFAMAWYEIACDVSDVRFIQWLRKRTSLKWVAAILFIAVPLLYLIVLYLLNYFSQPQMLRLCILTITLLIGGLITGANAVAALRRYSERVGSLV